MDMDGNGCSGFQSEVVLGGVISRNEGTYPSLCLLFYHSLAMSYWAESSWQGRATAPFFMIVNDAQPANRPPT